MTKGHLTLVENSPNASASVSPRRLSTDNQGQFQFELKDGEIRHIRIIVMDVVHGSKLSTLVAKLSPTTVVDLRNTLRFDQPGLSRDAFFEQLSRIRTAYFREPVEWPELKAYHLLANQRLPVRLYHEAVERWEGHIVLLVSKIDQASYLETALNRALSERRPHGWDIEQVA